MIWCDLYPLVDWVWLQAIHLPPAATGDVWRFGWVICFESFVPTAHPNSPYEQFTCKQISHFIQTSRKTELHNCSVRAQQSVFPLRTTKRSEIFYNFKWPSQNIKNSSWIWSYIRNYFSVWLFRFRDINSLNQNSMKLKFTKYFL